MDEVEVHHGCDEARHFIGLAVEEVLRLRRQDLGVAVAVGENGDIVGAVGALNQL